MNNKGPKILLKILYFLITFAFGIFLAITLPSYYAYYETPLGYIKEDLESGNYVDAFKVVGGYFNDEYIYLEKFSDNSGIVLFEAATLEVTDDKEATILNKAYAGYIFGVSSYNTYSTSNNASKIVLTTSSDDQYDISILDYDSDDDDVNDDVATLREKDFIYLDFPLKTYSSIKRLDFIDKDGNTFKSINLNLDFSGAFFTDVNDFIEEYNNNPTSTRFSELDQAFRSKSSHYLMSESADYTEESEKKATIIVVIYFLAIYIIYDLFIGRKYIIKGFKWILVKVFKIKFKDKSSVNNGSIYGTDYYCQVTICLDIKEISYFNKPVLIRYTKEDSVIEFNLLKESDYKDTKRIKAGNYPNLYLELDSDYYIEDLPDILNVQGFKKEFIIKLKKSKRD